MPGCDGSDEDQETCASGFACEIKLTCPSNTKEKSLGPDNIDDITCDCTSGDKAQYVLLPQGMAPFDFFDVKGALIFRNVPDQQSILGKYVILSEIGILGIFAEKTTQF